MTKVRRLMILGVMALIMMAVALPSAQAQQDWCFWGCNPSYWSAPTSAPTDPTPQWHCGWGWVWEDGELVWDWGCWQD